MSTTTGTTVSPFVLQRDDGEARWFLGTLVTIKAAAATTNGRVAVIEHLVPEGFGSPLHVHRNEDEWFYILDGAVTFWVGGRTVEAAAGAFVYGPRDVPHTFVVTSPEARFLLVAEPAGFDDFVRAVSEPAQTRTIPPVSSDPPDVERLTAIAAEYGIEILGPPGIPS
jgi:mannose-6-phosphate isomerase-like protein (cupin superfamily)